MNHGITKKTGKRFKVHRFPVLLLLLSGKHHEAFQIQHFPGQPICLV